MKILVLTLIGSANKKVYLIIDKIVDYHADGEGSVVRMLGGEWHYVKESPEFITNQLVDADTNPYVVYNSEEHK